MFGESFLTKTVWNKSIFISITQKQHFWETIIIDAASFCQQNLDSFPEIE